MVILKIVLNNPTALKMYNLYNWVNIGPHLYFWNKMHFTQFLHIQELA